jgi:CRP/FNR family transcriptional regulator
MENVIQQVLKLGSPKEFDKGKILFSAEEPANAFYYVESGEIRVYKMNEAGSEIEVRRFGPGNFIGEVILFSSDVFPVSAQAAKKSQVLYFPREKILNAIRQNSSLALLFLKILAHKCIVLNQRLDALNLQNIRERLIRYLLKECPSRPPYEFELKNKKVEIAQQLGTISETLSRNLRQLQKEKLVKVQGKRIKIINYAAFAKSVTS